MAPSKVWWYCSILVVFQCFSFFNIIYLCIYFSVICNYVSIFFALYLELKLEVKYLYLNIFLKRMYIFKYYYLYSCLIIQPINQITLIMWMSTFINYLRFISLLCTYLYKFKFRNLIISYYGIYYSDCLNRIKCYIKKISFEIRIASINLVISYTLNTSLL